MDNQSFTIRPCAGYTAELSDLTEIGKLLIKMGYRVRRKKIYRPGQKTAINALYIDDLEEGGEKNDPAGSGKTDSGS